MWEKISQSDLIDSWFSFANLPQKPQAQTIQTHTHKNPQKTKLETTALQ